MRTLFSNRSAPPGWLDLGSLHRNPNSYTATATKLVDPRRRKLDLEGASDQCNSALCPQHNQLLEQSPMPDWNDSRRTTQVYPENKEFGAKLPDRFDNPSWFKGYGCERKQHPFYATTSSLYGKFPPNVHTMPAMYTPMKNDFSEHLMSTGIERNRSLNIK